MKQVLKQMFLHLYLAALESQVKTHTQKSLRHFGEKEAKVQ